MSRIGKKIVLIPEKVKVNIGPDLVSVEGPRGKLSKPRLPKVDIKIEGNELSVIRQGEDAISNIAHGTMRALIANMVIGVSTGFQKILEINGVGYRAEVKGNILHLALGFSHPIEMVIPDGIKVSVDKQTVVTLESNDVEMLGQFSADVRKLRPPEPYKGKGIKYREEVIIRKVGKSAGK